MMTATEATLARLAEDKPEASKPEATPQSTPATAPKPEAVKPSAASAPAHSSTSAQRFSVTLALDPHVHAHYSKLAEKDDRSLAKYLQRFLRTTAPDPNAEKF